MSSVDRPRGAELIVTKSALKLIESYGIALSDVVEDSDIFNVITTENVAELVPTLKSNSSYLVLFELGHQKLQTVGVMSWLKCHGKHIHSVAIHDGNQKALTDLALQFCISQVINLSRLSDSIGFSNGKVYWSGNDRAEKQVRAIERSLLGVA